MGKWFAVATLALSLVAAAKEQRFDQPHIKRNGREYRLDYCMNFEIDCGQPGHKRKPRENPASEIEVHAPEPTPESKVPLMFEPPSRVDSNRL